MQKTRQKMNISEWQTEAHANAVNHGWWDQLATDADRKTKIQECLILIHSEVSEAFEHYRNGRELNEIFHDGNYSPPKPDGVPIELADIVIRILDFCGATGIDLEGAMEMKHEYNKTRPYRHGNKIA